MTTNQALPLRSASKWLSTRSLHHSRSQLASGRRCIQISTRPVGETPNIEQLSIGATTDISADRADASFEVLGSPFSLLKVSLSASQPFYTRQGTLVGLSGKPDNVISRLSLLEPVTRAVLGIPFFYRKISSASPATLLISSKSSYTSFATVHLDGTLDWMVARRNALLCWTGQTISLSPRMNTKLSLSHWGSTQVTGRGLLGLVGKGQIYEVDVQAGEQYVVHPSNLVAYSLNPSAPLPYRLKSSAYGLQIPGLNAFQRWANSVKFFRNMQQTSTWRVVARILFVLRTWSRRTIWGDRLFLQFEGPTTILLQTRGSRISEVLTERDVNEIADSEPATISKIYGMREANPTLVAEAAIEPVATPVKVSYASVDGKGQVEFSSSKT